MRVAVVDFDKTLIKCDSLFTILIKEYFFYDISFLALGFLIVMSRFRDEKYQLRVRSRFKRRLLYRLNSVPQYKMDKYISLFRENVRVDVVEHILAEKYDEIIILSASETCLIGNVLRGVLEPKTIIANSIDSDRGFITCYGKRKKELLYENYPELEHDISNGNIEPYVYTDSKSDKPIMKLAKKTFFVTQNGILEL